MSSRTTYSRLLACVPLLLPAVSAQGWAYGHGSPYSGDPRPWWGGGDGNGGDDNGTPLFDEFFGDEASKGRKALIAHAIVASAVWVLLIPLGGILLRLNIKSPWVLRVHAGLQIFSYLLYIVAVGLGIWLANQMHFGPFSFAWSDPHPRLGLAILALAFFQPILGAIHHRRFRKRVANAKEGKPGPKPGRTTAGYMHLWLGRILIVLGIVNGGLGIALAGRTRVQTDSSTRTAAIVYGCFAGLMFLLYLLIVVRFEINKAKRNRELQTTRGTAVPLDEVPPSYAESQDSLQKQQTGVTRYG